MVCIIILTLNQVSSQCKQLPLWFLPYLVLARRDELPSWAWYLNGVKNYYYKAKRSNTCTRKHWYVHGRSKLLSVVVTTVNYRVTTVNYRVFVNRTCHIRVRRPWPSTKQMLKLLSLALLFLHVFVLSICAVLVAVTCPPPLWWLLVYKTLNHFYSVKHSNISVTVFVARGTFYQH